VPLSSPKHPEPFLTIRAEKLDGDPPLRALCAGYEDGEWRSDHLSKHILKWLPEFALKYSEWKDLDASNAVELVGKAAQSIYSSEAYQKRGEFGEILLHAILRQCEQSIPAISKFFYKDAQNDTVKGFDAVHVVPRGEGFELWLGEVKFYNEISRAVTDVMEEIEKHLKRDYLRAEFTAIVNKLDGAWEGAAGLRALLSNNTSLDQIFASVCVPVLLTYDSQTVASHTNVCDAYTQEFTAEVERNRDAFEAKYRALLYSKKLPPSVSVRLYLLPLHQKATLVKQMDEALKKCQSIV
jgi:hypothetical protein